MNDVSRRTRNLLVAFLILSGGDAAIRLSRSTNDEPPVLSAVVSENIQQIRIQKGDDTVLLHREHESWTVTGPKAGPADPSAVEGLLRVLSRGVSMDVMVESHYEEGYGLKSPNVILVEVTLQNGESQGLFVGDDAKGGGTYVRLSGDNAVYRAAIGGRATYARRPGAWRDRRLLPHAAKDITHINVSGVSGQWELSRTTTIDSDGEHQTSHWELVNQPDFAVDTTTVDTLLQSLTRLRALSELEDDQWAGLDDPTATIHVRTGTNDEVHLLVSKTKDGVFAKSSQREARYQIPPNALDLILQSSDILQDRRFFRFSNASVNQTTVEMNGRSLTLARVDGLWQVTKPQTIQIPTERLNQWFEQLHEIRRANLKAVAAPPEAFDNVTRISIHTNDGSTHVLEAGAPLPSKSKTPNAYWGRHNGEVVVLSAGEFSALMRNMAR